MTALLDVADVAPYLDQLGLATADSTTVTALGGGVSNGVYLAQSGSTRLVVKQAMPALRVAGVWLAKVERTINEARAMELVGTRTPQLVPGVRHLDPIRCIVVVDAAPPDWTTWKEHLMAGRVDAQIGADLGIALAQWHTWITYDQASRAGLDDPEAFDQLRIDPYYRAAAAAAPAYAEVLHERVDDLLRGRGALVHGDFSPKNVLVGPGRPPWVIDFEVAHWGHPVFDVAFLVSHLVLKSVHLPEHHAAYAETVRRFLVAYQVAGGTAGDDVPSLIRHVGCLLVARVHGKSPAEYLTTVQTQTLLRRADTAFAGDVGCPDELCAGPTDVSDRPEGA